MFILLSPWAYCKLLLKMFWYEHWTRFPMQMNNERTIWNIHLFFFLRPINKNARHGKYFLYDNILLSFSSIQIVSLIVSLMAKWNCCFGFTSEYVVSSVATKCPRKHFIYQQQYVQCASEHFSIMLDLSLEENVIFFSRNLISFRIYKCFVCLRSSSFVCSRQRRPK